MATQSLNRTQTNYNTLYDTRWINNNTYISYSNIQVYPNDVRINNSSCIDSSNVISSLRNITSLLYNGSGAAKLSTTSLGVTITGTATYSGKFQKFPSDIRLKTIISSIDNPFEKLGNLKAFKYQPNEIAKTLYQMDNKIQIGLSAQEVQKFMPEAVFVDDNGYLTLSYESIVPVLIQSIKELKQELEILEAQNNL